MKHSQLTGIITFALLTVSVLIIVHFMIITGLKKSHDEFNRKINAVLDNKIDAELTLWGSSTTLVHFDAKKIEEETGLKTFNMGLNGTNFNQYYGLLLDFINNQPETKFLVININMHGFSKRNLFNNNHFWIPYLDNEKIYESALFVNEENWKVKNIPFFDLTIIDKHAFRPIVNTYLSGSFLEEVPLPSNFGFEPNNSKGYKGRDYSFTLDIQKKNVDKLIEVLKFLKNTNIQVALTATPSYIGHQNAALNMGEFKSMMSSLAADLDIPYFNFLEDSICYDKNLFYESVHLNSKGAEILTQKFIDRLSIELVEESHAR